MIRHTVIFRLKRPTDAAARAAFVGGVEAFAELAPHAEGPGKVEVDLSYFPDGAYSADICLSAVFTGREAFQAYLDSPPHVRLVEDWLIPYCETWLAVQADA